MPTKKSSTGTPAKQETVASRTRSKGAAPTEKNQTQDPASSPPHRSKPIHHDSESASTTGSKRKKGATKAGGPEGPRKTKRAKVEEESRKEDVEEEEDGGEDGAPPKRGRKQSPAKPTSSRKGKGAKTVPKKKKTEEAEDAEMQDPEAQPIDGVLERGHIYFFYRPKVAIGPEDTVSSLDDIAKFDFLLLPRATDANSKRRFRLFIVGKKRLPDRTKGNREVFWATLQKFGDDFGSQFKAKEVFGEQNYSTKTRGERHIEPARIAGRGHYALFSPKPDTPSQRATHLVYFLTHPSPEEIGAVQKELSIHASGSILLQIKNPTGSNPPNVGLRSDKQADYGKEIIDEKFGGKADGGTGKRFIAPNPASMLDFNGTEMLMIPDKHDVEDIMSDEVAEKDLERKAGKDAHSMTSQSVLKELRMDEETFPCDALEGDWL